MKFFTVSGLYFKPSRLPSLLKLATLGALLLLLAPANSAAQITNTQVVNIRIGSATGANTKFNTNALIYNFGITTSGGFNYLMTNMGFQLDRGNGVSQDVFVQVFNGFGGTGSLILTNRLNFTNVGTAFSQVNLLLGTNLTVGPGSYSVRLTSGATGSGADTYQFKLGALQLTTTNGTQLPVLQWVEDTDPNGTATTNLVTTNPILADYMISTNNVNFGNYRVGSTLTTNVTLTNNGFATTNNFTGSLLATATNSNAATVSGVTTNFIQQGQTDPFTVGLATTNVGTNSGTVTLSYRSATNGTAITTRPTWPTNIGSQSIAVTGVGYRLADDAVSTTNIAFGNFRLGLTTNFTTNVAVTNTAANDGFSERLGVSNSGTTGGGTLTNLPGLISAGSSSNVTVGLNNLVTAGTNSGTVTLGFNSSGVGTSGFAATNIGTTNINLTAVGYRLADDALSTTNVNLGNFRIVDGAGTGTVAVSNTATADGFSEGLGVSNSATSGGATVTNLPGSLVVAGGTTNVTVGLSTANAGTNSGTVTLGFNSSGVGTSGFAATNIGTTNINVSAVGYRLADDAVSTSNVNLGNFRIVDGAGTGSVTISNTATADGFSEGLGVSNSATSGATVTNLPGSLIAAGGNTNVTVGLSTANAGTNSGSVTLGFNSSGVGTSGFAATNIGSQTVNVTGVGYRLADDALSTTNVNLGNFRIVNGAGTGTVTVSNKATADGFSEGLGVANNGTTGSATVTNLPGGLIAAGGNTNVTVGLNTANAGTNSGSVTLGFNSDGAGTSGFGATNIGSQVVNVTGVGYRLASNAVSSTSVDLGNFRIVNGSGTASLTISNNAIADGFSEGLGVSNSATSGGATAGGVPSGLVAAGSSANVSVGLGTVSAGTNSGSLTFGFNSDGAGTSGFGATNIGSQVVNVTGVGYRLASESLSVSNVNLGRFHIGYTTNNGSLSATVGVTNTATADAYSEGLAVANDGTTGGAIVTGIPGGIIAAGSGTNITVGLGSVNAVGTNGGTVTLGFQSSGVGTSGLAATNIGSQVVNVVAQGYSGQALWNTDAGGSWNNFDNWDVPGGTPGIDGVLSTNDTATFAGAISSARTVSLNGQNPVLTALSFSNASASYTVAPGSGGAITMGTPTDQTPVISNAAGSHSVTAAIAMAYDTEAGVAANADLTLGGTLSGGVLLAKTGDGTLTLGGANTYSGGTRILGGVLGISSDANLGAVTASNTLVISNAALLSTASFTINGGRSISIAGTNGTIDVLDLTELTYNGDIVGTAQLTKAGLGTLSLGDSDAFTGPTLVSQGTVNLTTSNALANSVVTVATGASVLNNMTGANVSIGNLEGGGDVDAGSNNLVVGGEGQNSSFSGTVTVAGTNEFVKTGAGTMELSGTVTTPGGSTVIEQGAIRLAGANRLDSNAPVNVGASGLLDLNANSQRVSGLAGTGLITNTSGSTGTLDVFIAGGNTNQFGGTIAGPTDLRKSGNGLFELAGTNTHSGDTTVAGGFLKLSGTAANSLVIVEDTGTFGGTGTAGGLLVLDGGTVAPGASPGTLSITGNVVWNGGGNYNWQVFDTATNNTPGLTNTWDLIDAGGQLDLTALASTNRYNINIWSLSGLSPDVTGPAANFNPNQSYAWNILTAAGGINGFSADKFNLNAFSTNGTGGFVNSLAGGSFGISTFGNALQLTFTPGGPSAIPEPGTWAAAIMLAGAAAYARLRRRRAPTNVQDEKDLS